MKRIKKLSQRLNTGDFSPFYPIGVDSIYVDMFSGNNLEEEMHLGSPSSTIFDQDENSRSMIITEEYKKDNQNDKYYVMITTFETETDDKMNIVQKLYFRDGELKLKKTKTTSFISEEGSFQIKEVVE